MGLAVAMRAQCSVVEFICSSSLLHQYSGRKRCKQRMTEYHPQKSLSNNARFVVKNLHSSSYKNPFFHGDVRFIWMAIWLITGG